MNETPVLMKLRHSSFFFFFFVLSGLEMQVLKSVNTTQKMVVIQINQKIHILKFFKISSFKTKSEYQIF